MFNRPGVAGAVIKTPPSLIDSVSQSSFSSKYSKHQNSQTVKARDRKLWHNVNYLLCVLCVKCHFRVSHVTCLMSHFIFSFLYIFYIFFLLTHGWSYLLKGLLLVISFIILGPPWTIKKKLLLLSGTWHSGLQSHSSLSLWRQQKTSNNWHSSIFFFLVFFHPDNPV